MDDLAHRYAAWKAPQEDCTTLLWPAGGQLLTDARENNRRLAAADAVRIQNTPLPLLRQSLRRFLGVDADDQLLVATGHQTELHHPGVWAKNVLIDAAARKAGGIAAHFAVDTDAPKHLVLKFPGYVEPFTDDPAAAGPDWSGLVAPPTPTHLHRLIEGSAAAAQGLGFEPILPQFLSVVRRQTLEAEHLPKLLASSLHEVDWDLGLRYTMLLASPVWQSEPFLAFAHHILAHADRYAADYNASLKAYRERNGIRTPGRPMPDLARKDERCETPFWRDDLTRGRRVRLWVERSGDGWALAAGDDRFALDPNADAHDAAGRLLAWLRRHNLRVAPRALTLTTSLRLLAADQFVHGIGGGQYDQVADDIVARFFRLDPPKFGVTTATVYWPPAAGRTRTSVPKMLQHGHRLKHSLLGRRKRELVAAIDAAPRRSADRQALFQQMHAELDAAIARNAELQALEQAVRDASARLVEERALFDRELFYAVQPRERLERVIEAYRGAL